MKNKEQFGRSMLEMLTTLAIVGILSIVAFVGLRVLFVKKEVNDLYEDIQQLTLAVLERQDLMDMEPGTQIPLPDFAQTSYTIEAYRVDEKNGGAAFVIEISDISKQICIELLQRPFDTPFMLQVGDEDFNPDDPDYSRCNAFDETKLDLFVSTAWAKEKATIVIPMPATPTSSKSASKQEPVQKPEEEEMTPEKCKEKGGEWAALIKKCCEGGEWSYNSHYGWDCCNEKTKKVSLVNSPSDSRCCQQNAKAAFFIQVGNGIGGVGCCSGEVFQDYPGHLNCCEEPKVTYSNETASGSSKGTIVGVSDGGCGYQKWCCAPGWTAYCRDQGAPTCCNGEILTVESKPYCCEKGKKKMKIFDSEAEYCCNEGEKAMLTGVGPVCCAGEPYRALYSTNYTSRSEGLQYGCCKDGKKNVYVAGSQYYQACCKPGQYGYLDEANKTQLCCDTEPLYDAEKKTYFCGCKEGEEEKPVLGGNPNDKYCCPKDEVAYAKKVLQGPTTVEDLDTHQTTNDYSKVRTENACCPRDLLISNGIVNDLERYSCCSEEEKPTDVIGAPESQIKRICCNTKKYGKEPKAYWNHGSECCSGTVYDTGKKSGVDTYKGTNLYGCCLPGEKPTDVIDAPTYADKKVCCSTKEYGENPTAYWNGNSAQCCSGKVGNGKDGSKICCKDDKPNPSKVPGKDYQICCPNGQGAINDTQCCKDELIYTDKNGNEQCCNGSYDDPGTAARAQQKCCPKGKLFYTWQPYGSPVCCPSGAKILVEPESGGAYQCCPSGALGVFWGGAACGGCCYCKEYTDKNGHLVREECDPPWLD